MSFWHKNFSYRILAAQCKKKSEKWNKNWKKKKRILPNSGISNKNDYQKVHHMPELLCHKFAVPENLTYGFRWDFHAYEFNLLPLKRVLERWNKSEPNGSLKLRQLIL